MSVTGSGSLVHHPDFRRLWVGDSISQLGYSVGSLAIPYLAVTTLQATKFEMGLIGTLGGLGFLLVGLPAGAIIDRRAKRRVMITADLGRAAFLVSLPVAWWLGLLTIAQVMVVTTAVGILTVFFDVSYQSYLPFLVDHDHVVEGNAKLQGSQSVSQSAGPALGGLLLTRVGPPLVICLNAVGYLFSAFFLGRITHREAPPKTTENRRLTADIAEGLRFILRHHLLRRLVACTGLGNLAGSAVSALLVLYMVRQLHFSALTIGIVDSAVAIGGLLGALVATRLARRIGEGPSILAAAAAMLTCAFCYPLSSILPAEPTLILGGSAMMAAIVAYNIVTVSFRQRLCPPELLGRMNASARFLVWGTIPLGSFAGGVLGTTIGVVPTLWAGSAFGALALVPLLTPTLWRLRELPTYETSSGQ